MSVIQLLHGTDHIIEVPDIHIGNPHNDYGMGFYCTRVDEMAREWACKKNTDGFVNSYDFDTEGLKLLNLLDGTHTVLNWMALLLQFRTFKLDSEVAVDSSLLLVPFQDAFFRQTIAPAQREVRYHCLLVAV